MSDENLEAIFGRHYQPPPNAHVGLCGCGEPVRNLAERNAHLALIVRDWLLSQGSVEAVAQALSRQADNPPWESLDSIDQKIYLDDARAAVAVLVN